MGLFTAAHFDSLETLLVDQLQDLYDAEQRLVNALPKVAEAVNDLTLKAAIQQHLRETETHINRLERVLQSMSRNAQPRTCEAMIGLITEGRDAISATGDPAVKDAALIAAAQRVENSL